MTKRGDLDTALKILTDAAHLYPNKMIFANMGEAHLRRGDFEEALQAYNNALRLDPRYSNAINEAALVYLALASTASDDQTRTKYRIEADRWHHRALATLPPNVPEQRDAVERTFAEGVVRYAP
jgi:tetratricopeptide (TPR) repeat protein